MRAGNKEPSKRLATCIVLACLLVTTVCSCSSHAGSTRAAADESSHASFDSSATPAPHVGGSETRGAASIRTLDFTLVNFTRFNLHAIYVSPHDSTGWEENVLGRDQLFDGEYIKIRFSPEEKADLWDLRVEDENGNNAEWKNINLRAISRITLRAGVDVVIAEAE